MLCCGCLGGGGSKKDNSTSPDSGFSDDDTDIKHPVTNNGKTQHQVILQSNGSTKHVPVLTTPEKPPEKPARRDKTLTRSPPPAALDVQRDVSPSPSRDAIDAKRKAFFEEMYSPSPPGTPVDDMFRSRVNTLNRLSPAPPQTPTRATPVPPPQLDDDDGK